MSDFDQLNSLTDDMATANAPEPGKPWVFDSKVAASFSDMLARSIPGYKDMRSIIDRITHPLLSGTESSVIDLGSSNGESVASLIDNCPECKFLLTDISEPMRLALEKRFKSPALLTGCPPENILIEDLDLRQPYQYLEQAFTAKLTNIRLVQAILTLIFVPINFRTNIIQAVYNVLEPGGMFVITEKLLGNTAKTQNLLVDSYHGYKLEMGYSYDAIERKRMSLEYVQVPQTVSSIINELHSAGFNHIECVHRYLNFGTFIAIK